MVETKRCSPFVADAPDGWVPGCRTHQWVGAPWMTEESANRELSEHIASVSAEPPIEDPMKERGTLTVVDGPFRRLGKLRVADEGNCTAVFGGAECDLPEGDSLHHDETNPLFHKFRPADSKESTDKCTYIYTGAGGTYRGPCGKTRENHGPMMHDFRSAREKADSGSTPVERGAPAYNESRPASNRAGTIFELFAADAHARWTRWATTLLEKEPGISAERRARWAKLMVPYEQLSEADKEKDRGEVRRMLWGPS
jgi:hypothetical protein